VEVLVLTTGPFRQNGYVVIAPGGDTLIIDPGGESERYLACLESRNATLKGIANTHGHFDHIGAVQDLIEATGAPFLLHSGDLALLMRANLYKALFQSRDPIRVPGAVTHLETMSNPLVLGSFSVEWIETPGHTDGSVCLRIGNNLFTGDTLLPKGPGRTDLPGGNQHKLEKSLDVLRQLTPTLFAYPGHGRAMPLAEMLDRSATPEEDRHAGRN
jgi:glyoxylase-like metal-dependent hydrolase (beta-lactamase superfamily II)